MEKLYKCNSCKEIKPRGQWDYCKDCTNAWARKKYRENKDKKVEANKRWCENNPGYFEELQDKIICECGCKVSKASLPSHKKTKKHLQLMNTVNNNPLDV